ncbi:MAG: histidinol-phosphatase HisJ family protein [Clostridia bacterium]|nr:histidinol-phosphatase HisJ family protein [Clostridia bacterium]
MNYIDMHVHTDHSHDCKVPLREMCDTAIAKGLSAINISDHCDIWKWQRCDLYSAAKNSIIDVLDTRAAYHDRLTITAGVEIGDCFRNPKLSRQVAEIEGLDCVTGSVHSVFLDEERYPMASTDFSVLSDERIVEIARRYFEEVREMLELLHPDILAHLTYAARYIKKRYHREFSFMPYLEQLDDIYRYIIAHGIALEINTAYINDNRLPEEDVMLLRRYYSMGGRLITLGSDAHKTENLGNIFPAAHEILRGIGFTHACRFEERMMSRYAL